MTDTADTVAADRALKARHRAMWAQGDYPALAADIIAGLGESLVEACGVGPGDRVLDVAAGAGNASIPAALTGADVLATDLTPELLEAGMRLARRRGVRLRWQEADAEALPFDDAAFDTVLSVVGVMFAPHHRRTAGELLRVCRPGGTIGLVNWTPEGFVGRMLAALKPYAPPPPPGARPPPLWGDPEHLRELFGDMVTDVRTERGTVRVDRFATPEEFRDYFKERYGPMISVYRANAGDADRVAALDRDMADLAARHDRGTEPGRLVMEWEYLLFTARRTA
ncbi:class I SAM-dependent methyltransferase [Streptomyces poriticola]|uniref:class I SAM-dependent methyltransferase n=1 Tax=Streptomyces poriticola TaxID=3120506 RepID=UPI002FCDF339